MNFAIAEELYYLPVNAKHTCLLIAMHAQLMKMLILHHSQYVRQADNKVENALSVSRI